MKDFISMMEAALEGIKMRGKAEVGDKTMIDAIEPALKALKEANSQGLSTIDALEKAKDAAYQSVEYTKTIAAKKGRASYLGDRSIGFQDAGATSSYIIINTIYEELKQA